MNIEVVFITSGYSTGARIWELLAESMCLYSVVDNKTNIKYSVHEYLKKLSSESVKYFHAGLDVCEISFGEVQSKSVNLTRLDIDKCILNEKEAIGLLIPLFKNQDFVQARIYDDLYDNWQNALKISQLKAIDKYSEDIPMLSNGLPFPLEEKVVDISSNPGRWALKNNYIESVGSTMWFGDSFWDITGSNKAEVLNQGDWLEVEALPDGVIKVVSNAEPFTSAEGKEAEIQNKLRELLYGKASG